MRMCLAAWYRHLECGNRFTMGVCRPLPVRSVGTCHNVSFCMFAQLDSSCALPLEFPPAFRAVTVAGEYS